LQSLDETWRMNYFSMGYASSLLVRVTTMNIDLCL
jgi:hypothetical protein